MREKEEISHLVNGQYMPYKCDCGNSDFYVVKRHNEYGIGTVEMEFECECGIKHYWAYGQAARLDRVSCVRRE